MKLYFKLLLILFFSKLCAQNENHNDLKILNSIYDDKYGIELIPENTFNGKFDILVMPSYVYDKDVIAIYWSNYFYDDKRYKMVINPRQIYFRIISYNPNPKHLFWKTNITEEQFLKIKNYIPNHKKDVFENYGNHEFSYQFKKAISTKDKTQPAYTIELNRTYKNFKLLMNFINQSFDNKKDKISIPNRRNFKKINTIRIIYDIEDLNFQM